MKKILPGLCAGISLLAFAPVANAAPVTVNVRVEGPSSTLFEAPVTTDVRTFRFTGETATHQCDGTAATGGTSPAPAPVRNGALLTGLEAAGIPVHGSFSQFGASFDDIGGVSVAYNAATQKYLVEYKNGAASQLGGCSDTITTGDDVLYAYATGSETVLKLTGPASVKPGVSAAVKVSNAATGAPMAGAQVGSAVTGADGMANVGPYGSTGLQAPLKAQKAGAIRSNALRLCVSNGSDGLCGSADHSPALGRITTIGEQQRFAQGKGPRTLGGTVDADPAGLRDVQIRLTRNDGGRCSRFDGKAEHLVTIPRCGATHGTWFSVGSAAAWSYLLPARLPRGRYVLDVRTIDGAGNVDRTLQRTRNRVVFHVA